MDPMQRFEALAARARREDAPVADAASGVLRALSAPACRPAAACSTWRPSADWSVWLAPAALTGMAAALMALAVVGWSGFADPMSAWLKLTPEWWMP